MCLGFAACGWIVGIGDVTPGTGRDASFVGSSFDAYVSLDSGESEAQPSVPSATNSDADLPSSPDRAEASADGSERIPDAAGPVGTTAPPETGGAPDAQASVGPGPCQRLLQCCAGLVLPRQLATACFAASLADAGPLCNDGLALLADGGLCL
jgi:hypothetical protein